MHRFATTQSSFNKAKGQTKEEREIIELKKKVKQLEQSLLEMNFDKAVLIKENEDKLHLIEKLKKENEKLKKEKEIEADKLKREKEGELERIKREYESEQIQNKQQNVEFIYKLKSEFFPAAPYIESKLLEENKEKIRKLEGEKQHLKIELDRVAKLNNSIELKESRSVRGFKPNFLKNRNLKK